MRIIQLPSHRRNMRGAGIGSLFAKLTTLVKPLLKTAIRTARPIAKTTLKKLGSEGLNVATSTMADVLTNNMGVKEAAQKNLKKGWTRAKKTVKRNAKRALSAVGSEVAKDIKRRKQSGGSKKKKGKARPSVTKKKKSKRKRKPYRGIFQ